MKKILILTAFTFLFVAPKALAVGIQVSPSKVDIDFVESKGEFKLQVKNPTENVELYQIYPGNFTNLISVSPQSFTLEAGAQKEISVKLKEETKGTVITTDISVVSRNLAESSLAAATGVKIPLTVRYSGSSAGAASSSRLQNPLVMAGGIAIATIALLFILWKAGRKFASSKLHKEDSLLEKKGY